MKIKTAYNFQLILIDNLIECSSLSGNFVSFLFVYFFVFLFFCRPPLLIIAMCGSIRAIWCLLFFSFHVTDIPPNMDSITREAIFVLTQKAIILVNKTHGKQCFVPCR